MNNKLALAAVAAAATAAAASPCTASSPPTSGAQLRPPMGGSGIGDYTLHDFASKWMMQQDDLAEVGRHAQANRDLLANGDKRARIVLMGDSITANWADLAARDTAAVRLVNRGIGGQNTSQMLLRYEDDVVQLAPSAVVIMGGTNDLRAYVGDPALVGPSALERIRRNITAMADIAEGRRFKVVLCTLPPVGADRERVSRDAGAILAVNAWIKSFAASRGYAVADYHAALADPAGALPAALSPDGIHPNADGYAVMWPVLSRALERIEEPRP